MPEGTATTARLIKPTRHWKQRFDPKGSFVWRRPIRLGTRMSIIGEPLDQAVVDALGPAKLKRLWNVGLIEDADFVAPNVMTGRVPESEPDPAKVEPEVSPDALPEGVTVEGAGGWYTVTDGDGDSTKVRGKDQVDQVIQMIRDTRAAKAEAEAKALADAEAEANAQAEAQADEGGSAPGNVEE